MEKLWRQHQQSVGNHDYNRRHIFTRI